MPFRPFNLPACLCVICCLLSIFLTSCRTSSITDKEVVDTRIAKSLRHHVAHRYAELMQGRGLTGLSDDSFASSYWTHEQTRFSNFLSTGSQSPEMDLKSALSSLPPDLRADVGMCLDLLDTVLNTYLDKQVRLAGLAPAVSSEIHAMGPCELLGNDILDDFSYLLTIDDGPSADPTPIFATLSGADVRAIFFLVGEENATGFEDYVAAGHDLGIHSSTITDPDDTTSKHVASAFPSPRKWFRAHGGSRDAAFVAAVKAAGGRHLLWNIDSRDWEYTGFIGNEPANNAIAEDTTVATAVIISLLRGSGIVLFHETCNGAAEVINRYLRTMHAIGCHFVTPSDAWNLLTHPKTCPPPSGG